MKSLIEVLPRDQAHIVSERLTAYNDEVAPSENQQYVGYCRRDEAGEMVAGICGYTNWRWMFISHFWIDGSLRGSGSGTHLMEAAIAEARARDCIGVHLDTFSFQAPGFYEKLGFECFGEIADYPPGHKRYFLKLIL